jgi:hypothetical protein
LFRLKVGIIPPALWREIRTLEKNIYENNLSGNFVLTYYNDDSYVVGNLRLAGDTAMKKVVFLVKTDVWSYNVAQNLCKT